MEERQRTSCEDKRVGFDERGLKKKGLQIRRLDNLLRFHAGERDGKRPHERLF